MSLSTTIDRFDYCEATYVFCSEHHTGQNSDLYARLCRIGQWFKPGMGWKGKFEYLSEEGKAIYEAWCKKEDVLFEYDTVDYLLVNFHEADEDDDCTAYFLEHCTGEKLEDSMLVNFDRSDFVNICMPYTRDLINWYDNNEESVLKWFDEWQECLCVGGSRMDALVASDQSGSIEDPDDMKTAIVNTAMSYLGGQLLAQLENV